MIKTAVCIALSLSGYASNSYGRVGLRLGPDGGIHHVYQTSLAKGLLYEGDRVIEADGFKGHEHVDGTAFSYVEIKIKRLGETKTFTIQRLPKEQIHD